MTTSKATASDLPDPKDVASAPMGRTAGQQAESQVRAQVQRLGTSRAPRRSLSPLEEKPCPVLQASESGNKR